MGCLSGCRHLDVGLRYFKGRPNWRVADERLSLLATGRFDITVTRRLVGTAAQAERVGFLGSPSIQVGGGDVFAEPGARVGLTCRRYPAPDGYEGAPTIEQLRVVLADE